MGAVAVLVLVTACGADDGPDPVRATEPSATAGTTTPAPAPPTTAPPTTVPASGVPTFPADTLPQVERDPSRELVVLSDVRVAEHDGFDRVVMEFTGRGIPGWSTSYVDEPVQDGSGDVVDLAGDSVLDVYASNTTYPPEDPSYGGPRRIDGDGDGIAEVYVVGTFEGDTQVLVGVDGAPRPFRVFALPGPPRLVVDIADEGA